MPADVKIWGIACHPQIELVRATQLLDPIPPQVSFAHKLVSFEEGMRRYYYRGQWMIAEAGHLLLIPAGEVHRADAVGNPRMTIRVLSLSDAALAQTFMAHGLTLPALPRHLNPLISDPAIIHAFRQLHRLPEEFSSTMEQQTSLLRLLERLSVPASRSRAVGPSGQNELGPILRVKRYLEEHYADDITLMQLAQLTRLDPSYLCRAFKKSVGIPPHAYQIAVRVARARELLQRGCSVGQAALETGFYDQAHLTRHFVRTVQMPPARYARQVNSVQDDRHS